MASKTQVTSQTRALSVWLLVVQALGCTEAHAPAPEATVRPPLAEDPRTWVVPRSATESTNAGQPGAGDPAAAPGGQLAPPPEPPPDLAPHGVMFTDAERELMATLSPLPDVPPDTTNAVADDPAAAQLGRALFLDEHFSGPLKVASELGAVGEEGKVSCATCHFGPALDDPSPVSTGTGIGTRNSLSLVNSAYHPWTNWGGRFSAQWELSVAVVENSNVMNGSRLRVAHRIFLGHRALYEQVFEPMPDLTDLARFPSDGKPKPVPTETNPNPPDGAWEMMSPDDRQTINRILVNYGKAIAAFLRTLVSQRTPFDAFVAGNPHTLSLEAQQGLRLFLGKARCIQCHNGPLFSDGAFHNMGVPPADPSAPLDEGRFKDIPALLASPFNSASSWSDDPNSGRLTGLTNPPPEETRGQFRTPSLRGVTLSAPYTHAGMYLSLEELIQGFYNGGGEGAAGGRDPLLVPIHLAEQEVDQLVAFLDALTGEPVDSSLTVGERPAW